MARPTELTADLITEIAAWVRAGMPNEWAMKLAGKAESTYYKWYGRGETDLQEGEKTVYAEFVEAIEKAAAEFMLAKVQEIGHEGAPGAKWLLERRFPEVFGARVHLTAGLKTAQLRLPGLIGVVENGAAELENEAAAAATASRLNE